MTAPILIYPDFTKKFYLYIDVSDSGLGAVLSQKDKDGKEQVVAYASVTLKPNEQKYGVTEKEALAVVWAKDGSSTNCGLRQPIRELRQSCSSQSENCDRIAASCGSHL